MSFATLVLTHVYMMIVKEINTYIYIHILRSICPIVCTYYVH